LSALAAVPGAASAQSAADIHDLWQRETLTGDWGGLRSGLENHGFSFGLQQQSELWGNALGGLSRGGAADGLLTLSLDINLEKAVGWQGGRAFASAFQIEGVGPTPLRVGALQLVSNIEASESTKLFDLWIEQRLFDGNLSLRIGQEGANEEMMLSRYAALFLNSSFGYPALLALDLPSGGPNYPLAAPFARLSLQASREFTLVGAVYTADPAPPGTDDPQLRDRHGTAFRLNDNTLSFAELSYSPAVLLEFGQPGTYKLGLWFDSGRSGNPVGNSGSDYAVYAIVDQMLWKKPHTDAQGIGLFVGVMHAPDNRNLSDLFIEGGLNWKGIIPGRSYDIAGIAVAHAGIGAVAIADSEALAASGRARMPFEPGETVIEATYRAGLAPWLDLQPDLQYVVNPGAGIPTAQSALPLKNALIFGVRLTVNF
jgi:porin